MNDDKTLKLAVFGSDASEAAQVKRIDAFLACGFDVQGFMMRRANMNQTFAPFWKNLHLCDAENEKHSKRMLAVVKSIVKVLGHRDLLRGTDVIVARNLDMLMVAAVAQLVTPANSPTLVYECLDINNLMTSGGLRGKVFRWIERRLLARSTALVISAPDFLANYFEPYQGWDGPTALVENKIWIRDQGELPRPAPEDVPQRPDISEENPIVIGWIGTLRCQSSLDLLVAAAKSLGPNVQIAMHGVVHDHAVQDFDTVLAENANISFDGPYDYPGGLAEIYRDCDCVWSQDMWQWGTNSTWLLPNRIYEASYFGCPSIAVAGTGTGTRTAKGLGWTIPQPTSEALVALLQSLSANDFMTKRREILQEPDSQFLQSKEEIREAFSKVPLARPLSAA